MKQRDSKNLIKPATVTANNEDEFSLFRAAVKDVAPLIMSNKITHTLNSPRPIPRKVSQDIQSTSGDIFSDYIPSEIAIEVGDEWAFCALVYLIKLCGGCEKITGASRHD